MDDKRGLALALEEAKKGYEEGGVPVRVYVHSLGSRGKREARKE